MRPWIVFAAASVLAALAACAGKSQRPASADFADGPAGADVPICFFFTGDTSGVLWTCGCESGQYGGLARRATYVKRTMRPGDLAIDLGNIVAGEGPMQQAILKRPELFAATPDGLGRIRNASDARHLPISHLAGPEEIGDELEALAVPREQERARRWFAIELLDDHGGRRGR